MAPSTSYLTASSSGAKGPQKTYWTDSNIFFYSALLSNFWLDKAGQFSGSQPQVDTVERLKAMDIEHPDPDDMISSRLITNHSFVCGEQFMHAARAWFFEQGEEWSCKDMAESEVDMAMENWFRTSQ